MKKVICHLKSTAPYGQSRRYVVDKLEKESAADYEKRTWRNRMHVDGDGMVFIPPTALKNCLAEAAKYLGIQIPGKGKATYTKHFEAGVMCMDPIPLGIKGKDVQGLWLFVPADGKRGSGKRVDKCFPVIPAWEADVVVYVLDETITKDVFKQHLEEAGRFIGLGFFRPRNNGYFGRFTVESIKWDVE
jgi:hypothetical protein